MVDNLTAIDEKTLDEIASDFEQIEQHSEPSQPEIKTSELIAPIVGLVTKVAAPNWDIKPEENEALAQAYGDLLDKYFPDVAGHFGVELNALLITAAIFAPRISTPRFKEEESTEEKPEKIEGE